MIKFSIIRLDFYPEKEYISASELEKIIDTNTDIQRVRSRACATIMRLRNKGRKSRENSEKKFEQKKEQLLNKISYDLECKFQHEINKTIIWMHDINKFETILFETMLHKVITSLKSYIANISEKQCCIDAMLNDFIKKSLDSIKLEGRIVIHKNSSHSVLNNNQAKIIEDNSLRNTEVIIKNKYVSIHYDCFEQLNLILDEIYKQENINFNKSI
ncbi:hypothetical protein BW450_19375 [Salmonella enterica]|nr:hypothetical protein [Salmonella enterica]